MYCEACRRGEPQEDPSRQAAQFHASLLEAMHAMAQPMTLLSSHFYLAGSAGGSSPLAQQLQTDAEAGMEHLCTLFRLMQELVHVQCAPACVEPVPFSSVLKSLAEDAEAVFSGTGHRFHLDAGSEASQASEREPELRSSAGPEKHEPHQLPMVSIDRKRMRLALVSMLHMARESAQVGSSVTCSVAAEQSRLKVRFEPADALKEASETSFDEVSRLHLALARANILGQQAVFSVATQPFALSLDLPTIDEQAWAQADSQTRACLERLECL